MFVERNHFQIDSFFSQIEYQVWLVEWIVLVRGLGQFSAYPEGLQWGNLSSSCQVTLAEYCHSYPELTKLEELELWW